VLNYSGLEAYGPLVRNFFFTLNNSHYWEGNTSVFARAETRKRNANKQFHLKPKSVYDDITKNGHVRHG